MARRKTITLSSIKTAAAAYRAAAPARAKAKMSGQFVPQVARRAEYREMVGRIKSLAAAYSMRTGVENTVADLKEVKRPTIATVDRYLEEYERMQARAEAIRLSQKEKIENGPVIPAPKEEGTDAGAEAPPSDYLVRWLTERIEGLMASIAAAKHARGKDPAGPVFNALARALLIIRSMDTAQIDDLEKVLRKNEHSLETSLSKEDEYGDDERYDPSGQDGYEAAAAVIIEVIQSIDNAPDISDDELGRMTETYRSGYPEDDYSNGEWEDVF